MRSLVPVDSKRQDWPRLVAEADKDNVRRLNALETGVGGASRAKARFLYG